MRESSATDRMRWRRYRLRKKLGVEAVPYRQPGRPPRGTEDSPYLIDAPLSVLAEWMVYQLDQLPFEPDPVRARENAYFRACVKSWGVAFGQIVAKP